MTRVRTDNVFGTITDNPLTNVATTMNSAGLANLAAVSSAEALIVLDPNRVAGAPEIVVVTAHTGSATSATIQRGQFGTAARQHAQGTEWVHGPIASNATSPATAADDQGDYVPMNAWPSWTPTLTQSGAVTHTVTSATYTRHGRLIVVFADLAITGAGTANNDIVVGGLPVTAVSTAAILGMFWYFDAGTTIYAGTARGASTTSVQFQVSGQGADLGTFPNFAAANTDVLRFKVEYEAAS